MRHALSDSKGPLPRPSQCKISKGNPYSEIERKKEDALPKRGDFLHLKLYRRPEEDLQATGMTKYQEPLADLSTTFKFAPGATTSVPVSAVGSKR